MATRILSRRQMLKLAGSAVATAMGGSVLAACQQPPAPATPPPVQPPSASGVATQNAGQSAAEATAPAAAAAPPEQVTLKIYLPGDRPTAMDEVLAEAEKRMAATVNVKLDVTFAPWSDMTKMDLALQSGEPVDLMFDAPWYHIQTNISQGFYTVLDDLLPKYAPHVVAARPQSMWDANKFDGKIYGIPLGILAYSARQYLIRKDLRVKLGLPPVKTIDDLETLFREGHKAFPDMITLGSPAGPEFLTRLAGSDFDHSIRGTGNPDINPLYLKNNDAVVRNFFEDMDENLLGMFKRVRSWGEAGYIPADILSNGQNYTLGTGKVLVESNDDFGVYVQYQTALKGLGYDWEWMTLYDRSKKRVTNFLQYNFQCLPKVSKNKERSLGFLDWANQKDNYDLLAYGIKGKHWEPVGDDLYQQLSPDYSWFPYAWIWNPVMERNNQALGPEAADWYNWCKDPAHFEADKLTGLSLSNDKVLDQATQLQSLRTEYLTPLASGVADLDKTMAEYKAKANDLCKAVQADYAKQIEAFLAGKPA